MKQYLKTVLCFLLFLPTWFLLYAFLHEAGHALVGIAYGGTIESFVFWNFDAHVVIVNPEFTVFGESLMHIAGFLLPLVICVLAIGFYNEKVKFIGYHICYFLASSSIVGTMVFNATLAVFSLFIVISPREDMIGFLNTTGFHPLVVALGLFFLTGAYIAFCAAKGIYAKILSLLNSIHKTPKDETGDVTEKSNRKTKWHLIAVALLIATMLTSMSAVLVPYEPPSLLRTSAAIADVRTESNREYVFVAEETGIRIFDLDIQVQDGMTAFVIRDNAGTRYFSKIVEEDATSTFTLVLQEGTYLIQFLFLADLEVFADFLKEVGMDYEDMEKYRELFDNTTGDYSLQYTLRIR